MNARSFVAGADPTRSTCGTYPARPRRFPAMIMLAALAAAPGLQAQRHSLGSAPPTAPPSKPAPATASSPAPAGAPLIAPVSAGPGPLVFLPSDQPVPAPQALTRELTSDDEHTRSGALAALAAPGQYLGTGHVPYPHSVQLDLVQLGQSDQLDALLTAELDQHLVTAILVPEGDSWHRIGSMLLAHSFSDTATTPSSFVRPLRSWLQPDRYRAVFHGTATDAAGDFTENEADLNVVHNRAAIVLDFVSAARQCDPTGQVRPPHQSCELIQRWLEPDPADPTHRFTLITATGHSAAHESNDPLARSRNYRITHLHSFTCQPLVFSVPAMRFVPAANPAACPGHEPSAHPEHPDLPHLDPAHPDAAHPDAAHPEHTETPAAARPEHPENPGAAHHTRPDKPEPPVAEPPPQPSAVVPGPKTTPPSFP